MAVYVDPLLDHGWKMYGRGVKSSHLIADSTRELKAFAVFKLGMRVEWYQPLSSPHFDLVESRRKKAIDCGAIELSLRDFVSKIQELRERRNNGEDC